MKTKARASDSNVSSFYCQLPETSPNALFCSKNSLGKETKNHRLLFPVKMTEKTKANRCANILKTLQRTPQNPLKKEFELDTSHIHRRNVIGFSTTQQLEYNGTEMQEGRLRKSVLDLREQKKSLLEEGIQDPQFHQKLKPGTKFDGGLSPVTSLCANEKRKEQKLLLKYEKRLSMYGESMRGDKHQIALFFEDFLTDLTTILPQHSEILGKVKRLIGNLKNRESNTKSEECSTQSSVHSRQSEKALAILAKQDVQRDGASEHGCKPLPKKNHVKRQSKTIIRDLISTRRMEELIKIEDAKAPPQTVPKNKFNVPKIDLSKLGGSLKKDYNEEFFSKLDQFSESWRLEAENIKTLKL